MNELNFLEVNAAQITKEGISGNSFAFDYLAEIIVAL